MIHASPPSLLTLTMVYLSSFSGVNLPTLMPHQRPLIVALVSVALNFDSSSSWLSLGLAGAGEAGASLVSLGAPFPSDFPSWAYASFVGPVTIIAAATANRNP